MSDPKDTAGRPPGEKDAPDEGFLRRWARLKEEARRGISPAEAEPGEQAPAAEDAPAVPASAPGEAGDPEAEEKVLTDEDMPPLDSLGPDSDYSAFLSPGVSSDLRQKALRRLFSMPKFNIIDGLDDYCEDFTTWRPLGSIITADMKYRMQRELEEKLEKMSRPDEEGEPTRQASAQAEAATDTDESTNEDTPGGDTPDSGDESNEHRNA